MGKTNSANKAKIAKVKAQSVAAGREAFRPGSVYGYNIGTSKDEMRALVASIPEDRVRRIAEGSRKYDEAVWRKGRKAELTW